MIADQLAYINVVQSKNNQVSMSNKEPDPEKLNLAKQNHKIQSEFAQDKHETLPLATNKSPKALYLSEIEEMMCIGQVEAALQRLKTSLESKQQQWQEGQFTGVGNAESWSGMCPLGACNWLQVAREKQWLRGNLWDYVSMCCALLAIDNQPVGKHLSWYGLMMVRKGQKFEILMGLGNLHYNCHRWNVAMSFYKHSSELNQENAKVWEYMGWVYAFNWNMDIKALHCARNAMQIDPTNIQALFIEKFSLFYGHKLLKELQQIIEREPGYYRARTCYIANQLSKDPSKRIQEHISYIQTVDPQYTMYLSARGYWAYQKQNYEESESYFQKYINLYPHRFTGYYHYGRALNLMGKRDRAKQMLYKCLTIAPEYHDAFTELAEIQSVRGETSKQFQIMQRAYKMNPNIPQVLNCLGCCYDTESKYQQALKYFMQAHELQPENAKYICNTALALKACHQKDKAKQVLSRIQQISDEFVDSEKLATAANIFLSQLEDPKQALSLCQRSLVIDEEIDTTVYRVKSEAHLQLCQYDLALWYSIQSVYHTLKMSKEFLKNKIWSQLPLETRKSIIFEVSKQCCYDTAAVHLQFAKLFESISQIKQAFSRYQLVRKICLSDEEMNDSVTDQMQQMYGHGCSSYQRAIRGRVTPISRLKCLKLIEEYNELFTEMYIAKIM